MISKRVSFFAISLSLGLGLTLAFAAKPRKKVGRPQTTQRAIKLAGRPMSLPDRNPNMPTREQIAQKATREFLDKPHEGSSIQPNLKATGDDLKVQRTIATLLNNANASPPSRLDHFAWLNNSTELRHNGWHGQITSVKPTAGGWSVEVAVYPSLDNMRAMRRIVTSDYFNETYFFDGQNIRYVAGESPPSAVRALMMD